MRSSRMSLSSRMAKSIISGGKRHWQLENPQSRWALIRFLASMPRDRARARARARVRVRGNSVRARRCG